MYPKLLCILWIKRCRAEEKKRKAQGTLRRLVCCFSRCIYFEHFSFHFSSQMSWCSFTERILTHIHFINECICFINFILSSYKMYKITSTHAHRHTKFCLYVCTLAFEPVSKCTFMVPASS